MLKSGELGSKTQKVEFASKPKVEFLDKQYNYGTVCYLDDCGNDDSNKDENEYD